MVVFVVDDHCNADAPRTSLLKSTVLLVATASKNWGKMRVAFDCEGVNLSQIGSIELVAIFFDVSTNGNNVFLVDVGKGGARRGERIAALKKLFECQAVEKIIHDCRMDCDALFHHCGILVHNIHDTSCFHAAITMSEDMGLNDVLLSNGMATNPIRDKSIYSRNPQFWATRPLTAQMIEWASGDVDKLISLADKQLARLGTGNLTASKLKSTDYATKFKDMRVEQGLVCKGSVGAFIGPHGCNLRSLQKRMGTLIYQDRQRGSWFVYYESPSSLSSVRRAMGY